MLSKNKGDMILLMFDAHKLDISTELRETIENLKGNERKCFLLLNKCDTVTGNKIFLIERSS